RSHPQSAGAAAELRQAGRARPDRGDHRSDRPRCGDGFGAEDGGAPMSDSPHDIAMAAEPWRQRVVRTLLYGRDPNRSEKARVRVGIAIIAFALVYSVIAVRLVMFAVSDDGSGGRRATRDAIATARPDIVDR